MVIAKENAKQNQYEELFMVASSCNLVEHFEPNRLLEMSKLFKHETGLPVDIWVDEGKTFSRSGHGRRIKFQGEKNNPNTHTWIPLTIDVNPEIPKNVKHKGHDLTSAEFDKIKKFVSLNYKNLNRLGDNGYGVLSFSKDMKRV